MEKKNSKLITKADIIMLTIIIVIFAIVYFAFFYNRVDGKHVVISVAGEKIAEYPINIDTEYLVNNTYGENKVVIKNGVVSIEYANCKDKICVNHKSINVEGETIICLPHKLVVEIIK